MQPQKDRITTPSINWQALPPLLDPNEHISLNANPVDAVMIALRSSESKRIYQSRLQSVARMIDTQLTFRQVPWQCLRHQHISAIKKALLRAGYSHSSINGTLSALRAIAKAAFRLRIMSAEDLFEINNIAMLRARQVSTVRKINHSDQRSLAQACHNTTYATTATRDTLLFALLHSCGLRRTELAAINVEHFDKVSSRLTVTSKKGQQRFCYPDNAAIAALYHWLECRGQMDGPLFLSIGKTGLINYKRGRISDQTIYNIVKKRQQQAGIDNCAPLDFRNAFATDLLDKGHDLAAVQLLMGHRDPKTTNQYRGVPLQPFQRNVAPARPFA